MLTVKRKNKAVTWLSYSSFYSMYSKCKETNTWWAAGKKSVRMLIIIKNLRLPVVVYSLKVRLLGNLNYQSINQSIKINQQKLLSKQSSTKFESRPFSDNLTAYRKRNSCETALVSLTENWKKARSWWKQNCWGSLNFSTDINLSCWLNWKLTV